MTSVTKLDCYLALKIKQEDLIKILSNRDDIQVDGRQADPLDEALAVSARDNAVGMMNQQRQLLTRVRKAIDRLERVDDEDGRVFGTCSDCGEEIEEKRMLAVPWAERCVGCQGIYEEEGEIR